MPVNYSMTTTNAYDQDRPDLAAAVSDYLDLRTSGDDGSISRQFDATFTWELSAGLDVPFTAINFGGSYSENYTMSDTYTTNVQPGEKARLIYIPKFHVVEGRFTKTEGGDIIPNPTGNSVPTPIITDYSDVPGTASAPIPHRGAFRLQFESPTFYTDSLFKGDAITLTKGNWDWGSFPNDAISSLRVPDGYSVVVYTSILH
jgi:hypothetical protein